MNPMVKYSLGRLGLFLVALLILLPIPQPSLPLKLLAALLISFSLSWFVLKRWRDEASVQLADAFGRRKAQKEQLRAALAGEDEPAPTPQRPAEPRD